MKLGFVGGGALTGAMLTGLKGFSPESIWVAEHKEARRRELAESFGIHPCASAGDFPSELDLITLAVKPKDINIALKETTNVAPGALVVSVAAGVKLALLEETLESRPVIRVMPNTPIAVGQGMTVYAPGRHVTDADLDKAKHLWGALGEFMPIDESLMDAVTGLSGSGPAFAFLIIDALAEGGVAAGLPRTVSQKLAAQTLLGAAQMVIGTNLHPALLQNQVTSPAGTTVQGLRVLEKYKTRSALIEAVLAAYEKSKSF